VKFDLSNENILVEKAADFLVGPYLESIVGCQIDKESDLSEQSDE
jgi:hypothetical protein